MEYLNMYAYTLPKHEELKQKAIKMRKYLEYDIFDKKVRIKSNIPKWALQVIFNIHQQNNTTYFPDNVIMFILIQALVNIDLNKSIDRINNIQLAITPYETKRLEWWRANDKYSDSYIKQAIETYGNQKDNNKLMCLAIQLRVRDMIQDVKEELEKVLY